jgi:hypothetical protein
MTTNTLNAVYADTALIDVKAATTWTDAARAAIDAGLLNVTRDARKLNSEGALVGFDSKALKAESDKYLSVALPAWLNYAVTELSNALAEIKALTKRSSEAAVAKARARLTTAQDTLSVQVDGVRVFVNTSDYAFLTMSSADYKAWSHPDKKLLGKFRDDKRNIMRVQFTRLVSKAWSLAGTKKQSTPETYAELLVRFSKALTAADATGALKYGSDFESRQITPEVIKYCFDLLQDGTLLPQAVKQAKQEAVKQSKQAAKRASK